MSRTVYGKELELAIEHFPDTSGDLKRSKLEETELFLLVLDGLRSMGVPFIRSKYGYSYRDFSFADASPSKDIYDIYSWLGARFYLDQAHPEYSTEERTSAAKTIEAELNSMNLLELALYYGTKKLHAEGFTGEIELLKNNVDLRGNTWGCHSNILCDRARPEEPKGESEVDLFSNLIAVFVPHLATSVIYTGAGSLLSETGDLGWFISQRAFSVEEEVSSSTTSKRALFNLKDEPLALRELYRRMHITCFDHNMSEFAGWLGLGITGLLKEAVERGNIGLTRSAPGEKPVFDLAIGTFDSGEYAPAVCVVREIAKNPLNFRFPLRNGSHVTALEHQREICRRLWRNYQQGVFRDNAAANPLLTGLEATLKSLETGTSFARKRLDYLIKEDWIARTLHKKQEAFAKANPAFKDRLVYDLNALKRWEWFVLKLKDLRLDRDLDAARKADPGINIKEFCDSRMCMADRIQFNRHLKYADVDLQLLPEARLAYNLLQRTNNQYHSVRRHRSLWQTLFPNFPPHPFYFLREKGWIPPAHEMVSGLPRDIDDFKGLEDAVEKIKRLKPPTDTRAYWRGRFVKTYAGKDAFVKWDSVELLDGPRLRKVDLPHPIEPPTTERSYAERFRDAGISLD